MRSIVFIFIAMLTITSYAEQGSLKPVPNNENADVYYWDKTQAHPDNASLITARMLVNNYGGGKASIVMDFTVNCSSDKPTMNLNQIEGYTESFAKGELYDIIKDESNRFELIDTDSPGDPFLYIYNQICPK